MKTRVLMITYNRPAYTAMSLERLCQTMPANARITVWDNASGQETRDVLKKYEGHPVVERIIYNKTNDKLRGPTNWFWQNAGDAELLGKVDDDCLMPDGWVETLEQAHRDVPETGIISAWLFPEEDFVPDLAARKIKQFGAHKIFRNCWVGGSGYLLKRSVFDKIGMLRDNESFTTFCVRAAGAGYVNGWYYPFIYQEHMDDPRAPHTGIKTEADFKKMNPLSAGTFAAKNIEEWTAKLREVALSLQKASYDPSDYLGWRAWLYIRLHRLFGKTYTPRA